MIAALLFRGLARGKARFLCALAGVATATAAVVFVFSLAETNRAQAPALAARAAAPWQAWQFSFEGPAGNEGKKAPVTAPPIAPDLSLPLVQMTIDYRPGGRVLQGPPMRAVLAPAPAGSPYRAAPLVGGRWVDQSAASHEAVCTLNTLKRFGRGEPPPLGSEITFVGLRGTMTARVVGYLAETKLPPGWPGVFVNQAAFAALAGERQGQWRGWREKKEALGATVLTAESETVTAGFTGDEQRRMNYARPLLLVAAVLTALCLLVNSLLLSVEANRGAWGILRTVGLTAGGVMRLVVAEACVVTLCGFFVGAVCALGALAMYVAADAVAFPMGLSLDLRALTVTGVTAAAVAIVASLLALRPALAVRPLEIRRSGLRKRRHGMTVAFACGYAAFVAVEVWGASLMRAFVPSPEWPDAIVSLLPGGVSSFEIEKLRKLPGVTRVSELYPLQLNFDPEEPMAVKGRGAERMPGRRGPKPCRNALFLAAEWLPAFRFVEGTRETCVKALETSDACVISDMIARARNLHAGDTLRVALNGRGPRTVVSLPIAGVVDVNWHMVTSRGLVRGLNRMPGMTDGPVFVSLDTLSSLDARPADLVRMTHVWVEYEPAFLAEKGVFPAGRAVERAIAEALGWPEGVTVRLHARDEIADGTLAHGSAVIGQAARVPFVFLAILSLGFIALLVAEADAQKRLFAVLRAVGATRAQVAARLAAGAVKTALQGVAWGLPLGAATGWLFAIKTGRVWPGLPTYFEVPVQILAEGTLGAFVFVLIVAIPTALVLVARRRYR